MRLFSLTFTLFIVVCIVFPTPKTSIIRKLLLEVQRSLFVYVISVATVFVSYDEYDVRCVNYYRAVFEMFIIRAR